MKRFISFALTCLLISLLVFQVAAVTPEQAESAPKSSNDYQESGNTGANPESVSTPENDAINVNKEAKLNELLTTKSAAMATRATYSVPMTVIQQETSYWCGLTSALMLINSNGGGNSVGTRSATHAWSYYCWYGTGSHPNWPHTCVRTWSSKQCQLDYEMGTVPFGGASWSQISSRANAYTSGFSYGYRRITTSSDLYNRLYSTIAGDGKPCIIWVNAYKLNRYPNGWNGHYICVNSLTTGSSQSNSMVGIKDCNYNTNYGGTYSETLSIVTSAMQTVSDYNLLW